MQNATPQAIALSRRTVIGLILGASALSTLIGAGVLSGLQPPSSPHQAVVHHIHGSLAHNFGSLAELKGGATLVVLGTVVSQQNEVDAYGVPSTLSMFQVQQTLFGAQLEGTSLVVRQLGGVGADGAKWRDDEFPPLTSGARYVLFLTPALSQGEYYTVGAYQGVFAVDSNGDVTSFTKVTTGGFQIGVPVQAMSLAGFIHQVQATAAVSPRVP